MSNFFFSLKSMKPQVENQAGSLTYVTTKEVPGFVNISFAHLKLIPQGYLEPLWHPNAHKLGHCEQGKALVQMHAPGSNEIFTLQKGEMFFIPRGYVHSIENIGNEECIINFTFNHSIPEVMQLSGSVSSISDSVFNSTFNTQGKFVDGLRKSNKNHQLRVLSTQRAGCSTIANRYKFDIGESNKSISTKGGYLQYGLKNNLAVLDGLGILGFGLNLKGAVEPHWHTNAGELVYIVKGKTQITILSPDGKIDVLKVNGGEGAFAPASYFHNIENIGSENVEVIAFFSHAEPDYIGIGEVIGSYSNEALSTIFNVDPSCFNHLEKPKGPLVIVPT